MLVHSRYELAKGASDNHDNHNPKTERVRGERQRDMERHRDTERQRMLRINYVERVPDRSS